MGRGKSFCGKIIFQTFSWTPVTSGVPLECGSPHSFIALTVFAVVFNTSSPLFTLGFFSSASRSRTALETTKEMTLAICDQRLAMAVLSSPSKSFLLKVAELTTLDAVTLGKLLVAAVKAAQFFVHAGCASEQFAHFAFALSFFWK